MALGLSGEIMPLRRLARRIFLALTGFVLAISGTALPAMADKVGVAAAVNPDAFSSLAGSPKTQLNIGKSIFYNERINTTGSGLVQVLLVDGSTFMVGPGSDLVIDKFVYNPKKGTGELTASFTKGVMRFVGGKISKNEDAVNINTPAGSLAIRGCIVMGKIISPSNYGFLLVYGDYMKLKGMTVFQPGNGFFATNGQVVMGPPPKNFTNDVMAGLTNSNPPPANPTQPGGNPPTTFLNAQADVNNIDQFISDATAQQIQETIAKEIAELVDTSTPNETPVETPGEAPPGPAGEPTIIPTIPIENPSGPTEVSNTPPDTGGTPPDTGGTPPDTGGTPPPSDTLALGYAAGAFTKENRRPNDAPAGTLISYSPTDVALLFDGTTKAFSGGVFNLFSNDDGGAKITFVPVSAPSSIGATFQQQIEASGIFFGAAATTSDNPNTSILIYERTLATDPPTPPTFDTTSGQTVTSGTATLVGVTGSGQLFCESCDFMKWGAWLAVLDVADHPDAEQEQSDPTDHTTHINAVGWWVAADSLTTIGQLPTMGAASYQGQTIGQVAYNPGEGGWQNFIAKGDVHMDWDFQQRAGILDIKNFGVPGNGDMPVLNSVGNRMDMPGRVAADLNRFSGPLLGTLGPQGEQPITVTGVANGSFAANGNDKTAGIIGNFSVANTGDRTFYQASGVFGAGRVGPVNPNGSVDLQSGTFIRNYGPAGNIGLR